ncbi:uncharacterized protein L3040_002729 [Drepanopeziza brunnea f. sp. 'multigermtubi']|nr:hypothetical protein L3040_002729 [Drepanopeziza brunnea f. sp. 'multigermtubi']
METPVKTHQDFILLTANLGSETSTEIINFIAQYSTTPHSLADLSQALTLVATNLHSLYSTISQYGPNTNYDDSLTRPLIACLHAIFEKVGRALEEGVEAEKEYGDEWEDLERVGGGGRSVVRPRNPNAFNHAGCVRFVRVLGGYETTDELVWYLETLKGHVFHVAKAIRYLALKRMESESTLSAEEKATMKKLTSRVVDLSGELEFRKQELEVLAERWKAGDDLTDTGKKMDEVVIIPRPNRRIDDDALSWRSFDSFESDSAFIESNEIYEIWIIRKIEGQTRRMERNWTFLGLRVSEHLNDEVYSVEGMPCSQEKMKSKYEASKIGAGVLERRLANLPNSIYREIQWLVQERMRISSVSRRLRTWKLIDVKPTTPIMPRQPQSWMSWLMGKQNNSDQMVVLKAESSREEGMTYPNRITDPFRKHGRIPSDRRRRRTRSPVDIRLEERDERGEYVGDRRRGEIPSMPDPTPEEAHRKIEEMLAELVASGKQDVAS